jgi:hypothetical protein
MAVIFPFGEGATDQIVFDFLQSKLFSDQDINKFVSVNGKDNFPLRIKQIVEGEILPNRSFSILIFRDLDAGERAESVAQAFRDIVWDLLSRWGLRPGIQPHQQHANLYVCVQPSSTTEPGLRCCLHLADNSTLGLPMKLLNATTDGYILAAGLTDAVLERFAAKASSDVQAIHTLVTALIPDTIRQTNILFEQDKDYLAAYLCATRFWAIHRTEEQARLMRIILERIWKYDKNAFQQMFASWQMAVDEALK